MSQVPVISGVSPMLPTIPQGLLDQYNTLATEMTSGFGGSLNVIKPGKLDFTLIEGGNRRQVANGNVAGVLLGMAPHDHCVWYERAYMPGQEPETPDLVWNWADRNVFPDAVPPRIRQKVEKQGALRWDFAIKRRSVWALLSVAADGSASLNLETPYVFDVPSSSLYGRGKPEANMYSYSGLVSLCQRLSQPPQFRCSPAMFLTRINLDATSPVPGVVVFSPYIDRTNNAIQFLSNEVFENVLSMMFSQQVKDLLVVQDKLDWHGAGSAPQATPATPPVQAATEAPAPAATPNVPPAQSAATPVSPTATTVDTPQATVMSQSTQTQSSGTNNDTLARARTILNQANAAKQMATPQATAPAAASANAGVTAQAVNALADILG